MNEPAGPDATDSGLDPRTAATLAYAASSLTGLLFLFIERRNAFVRFHAMQSTLLGILWVIWVVICATAFATLIVNPTAFLVLLAVGWLTLFVFLVAWVLCLFRAYRGERWKLPYFGGVAERLLR
jgi:uncharacterized membrane protein